MVGVLLTELMLKMELQRRCANFQMANGMCFGRMLTTVKIQLLVDLHGTMQIDGRDMYWFF